MIYPNNSTLASLRFASLRSSPTSVASVGVIFPITQAIGMGFSRRDAALSEFGSLLGHVRTLWGAFHCWEIQEGGGAPWVRMVQKLGDDGSHDDRAYTIANSLAYSSTNDSTKSRTDASANCISFPRANHAT